MRFAVVGHTEWVQFARVGHVPRAGEIVHATDVWEEAAGGGPVTAVQLARLGAEVAFTTALGRDELGRRAEEQLRRQGVRPVVQWRTEPTRRAFTYVDDAGERTITVLGDKLLPAAPLDLAGRDACLFVSGEVDALRAARAAPFLAAVGREARTLRAAGVPLDLLIASASDPGEDVEGIEAELVVLTDGADGGSANGRRYEAAPLPGPVADAYGCGDSFGAALAFALVRGDDLDAALAGAARAGAAVLTGRGPYPAQPTSF
jgi:ribokinase